MSDGIPPGRAVTPSKKPTVFCARPWGGPEPFESVTVGHHYELESLLAAKDAALAEARKERDEARAEATVYRSWLNSYALDKARHEIAESKARRALGSKVGGS